MFTFMLIDMWSSILYICDCGQWECGTRWSNGRGLLAIGDSLNGPH